MVWGGGKMIYWCWAYIVFLTITVLFPVYWKIMYQKTTGYPLRSYFSTGYRYNQLRFVFRQEVKFCQFRSWLYCIRIKRDLKALSGWRGAEAVTYPIFCFTLLCRQKALHSTSHLHAAARWPTRWRSIMTGQNGRYGPYRRHRLLRGCKGCWLPGDGHKKNAGVYSCVFGFLTYVTQEHRSGRL